MQGEISINVTVSTPTPTEGSSVAFTCKFAYNTGNVANVLWRYGHQIRTAAKIVDWRYNDPDNVYYGSGYSASKHQMTIAEIVTGGQTRLSIDSVVPQQDDGRYWCEAVYVGHFDNAYADIQVVGKCETEECKLLDNAYADIRGLCPKHTSGRWLLATSIGQPARL